MEILNFIENKFIANTHNKKMAITNPATLEIIGQLHIAEKTEVELAVTAGHKASFEWKELPAIERASYLRKMAGLIEKNLDHLAHLEMINTGKPLKIARAVDIPRAAKNLSFFADLATQFSSESHHNPNSFNFTLRSALGVVATISPWNLPLYLFTWKIAPALAAGNTVVAKPSELTPMTANLLAQICLEAKLPPGVLNIIHGPGNITGEELIRHPLIKAVSFTGGTQTGKHIAEVCGSLLKKTSLELGGKNPTLIFSDCDYEMAIDGALKASFSNQGQICLCGSRILVEDSIYEKFKNDFVERAKKLVVGNPEDPAVSLGSLISPAHLQKVQTMVDEALNFGGKILCGGNPVKLSPPFNQGSFFAPTVIEGLSQECPTNQQEIFGPVVTLQRFSSDAEALNLANNVNMGLSASVWTKNLDRALYFSKNLEVGMVWINTWMERDLRTPFGGVKDSGLGREGGIEAMRFFTEAKNINFKIP